MVRDDGQLTGDEVSGVLEGIEASGLAGDDKRKAAVLMAAMAVARRKGSNARLEDGLSVEVRAEVGDEVVAMMYKIYKNTKTQLVLIHFRHRGRALGNPTSSPLASISRALQEWAAVALDTKPPLGTWRRVVERVSTPRGAAPTAEALAAVPNLQVSGDPDGGIRVKLAVDDEDVEAALPTVQAV